MGPRRRSGVSQFPPTGAESGHSGSYPGRCSGCALAWVKRQAHHRGRCTGCRWCGVRPCAGWLRAWRTRSRVEVRGAGRRGRAVVRLLLRDAGFASEANLAALKQRRITACLAPGRARHGGADATGRRRLTRRPLMSAMAAQLNGQAGEVAAASGSRWSNRCPGRSSRPGLQAVAAARARSGPGRTGDDLHRPRPPQACKGQSLSHGAAS